MIPESSRELYESLVANKPHFLKECLKEFWEELDDCSDIVSVRGHCLRCGLVFDSVGHLTHMSMTETQKGVLNIFFTQERYINKEITLETFHKKILEVVFRLEDIIRKNLNHIENFTRG